MEDQTNENAPASGKEDNPQLKPKEVPATGATYPNELNDRQGAGSPYAGTQSKNPQAPDGLQTPREEDPDAGSTPPAPETTGAEYDANDSYGHKGAAERKSSEGSDNMEESAPLR